MTGTDELEFPEAELLALAAQYEQMIEGVVTRRWAERFAKKAAMLRDAVACHATLRERCLVAELRYRRLRDNAA